MPKQTKSQSIGRAGERWFQQALPSTWILQSPTDDVGVDGLVVICEESYLNGLEFRVQIKSSEAWSIYENSVVYLGLKRETLRYLLTGFTPTLLVLYEVSNNRGVCSWINHLAYEDFSLLRGNSKTVSLRVPMNRQISENNWQHIGRELHGMSTSIGRHISSSGRALPVMYFINQMLEVIDHLDFAANATTENGKKVNEDGGVLAELEISCHRDVILAVRTLENNLKDVGIEVVGLTEFANGYLEKCSTFIPSFESIIDEPGLIKKAHVDGEQLKKRRQGFIRSIVGVMRQASKLGLRFAMENRSD